MLREIIRSALAKNKIVILSALLIALAFIYPSAVLTEGSVKMNVEILQAPSVTKNDFDFSGINPASSPVGRVLGAQSSRKKNSITIYFLLLINPLLLI